MIKCVLFDLDGVIVDTAKYHYLAWKQLANDCLGVDFTEEFNENLKGISRVESLQKILDHAGKEISTEDFDKYLKLKNDWYLELIKNMTPDEILPGVIDFIAYLKENHIKISLGSVSKNAGMILEKVGLYSVFDAIIDGNKITKGKPDPEVFLKGAAELGQNPEECLVVEDAEAGIEAALAAQMHTLGIGQKEVLHRAHQVVVNLSEKDAEAILAQY